MARTSKSRSKSRSTSRGSRHRSTSTSLRAVTAHSATSSSLSTPVECITTLVATFLSLLTTDTDIAPSELRDSGRHKMLELARLRGINVDEYPIDPEGGHVQCPYLIFDADHWTKETMREAAGPTFLDAFLSTEANGDINWIASFENTAAVDQVMINPSVGDAEHPPRRIPAEDTNPPSTMPDLNSLKLQLFPCCGAARSVVIAIATEVYGIMAGAGAKPHELILSFDSTRMANAFAHMISGWTLGGPPISVKPLVTPELSRRLPAHHLNEPSLKVRSQSDSALHTHSINRRHRDLLTRRDHPERGIANDALPSHLIEETVTSIRQLICKENVTAMQLRDSGRVSFTSIMRHSGRPLKPYDVSPQGEVQSPFVRFVGDDWSVDAIKSDAGQEYKDVIVTADAAGRRVIYLLLESSEAVDRLLRRSGQTLNPSRVWQVVEIPSLPIYSSNRLSVYPLLAEAKRMMETISLHMPEFKLTEDKHTKDLYEVETQSPLQAAFIHCTLSKWCLGGVPITVTQLK